MKTRSARTFATLTVGIACGLTISSLHAAPVVYEPFGQTAGNLGGKSGGTGTTGNYATIGTSLVVETTGLSFGASLPVTGGLARKTTTTGTQWANNITTGTVASNSIKNAGLLNHGATVWFSFLFKMDNASVGNGEAALILGGSGISGANGLPIQNSASGFGIQMSTWQTYYAACAYNTGARSSSSTVGWGDRTVPKLMVGRIVWGSDATQPDTLYVYTPGTDLALPVATAQISSIIDQSQFNTIAFSTKEGAPEFDEIRFGATYLDVIGAAPTAAYWDTDDTTPGSGIDDTPDGTWNTDNLWNPVADGTGTAAAWTANQAAVFAASTDATGTYGVTVDSTQQIGGLTFEEGTVTLSGGTALELHATGGAIDVRLLAATATVSTPITQPSLGGNLYKDGSGTLVLSGDNTYDCPTIMAGGTLVLSGDNSGATGAMTLAGGATRFDSTLAIPGSGRSVTVGTGAVAMFGSALDNTAIAGGLLRIVAASPGIIAADNNAGDNFDLNTGGLTAAYFGAVGSVNYTGTLTPNGNYRLGGAGGTLTLPNTNAVTGGGKTLTVNGPGTVILEASNNYTGTTTINSGATLSKLASNSSSATTINGGGTFIVGNASSTGGAGVTLNGALIVASSTAFNTGANQIFFSNGGSIRSDGTTARSVAGRLNGNANNAIILGDRVNSGKLTFTVGCSLSSSGTFYTCNSDVEFTAGFLASGLGPTKQGPGTMTFSAANLFTGTTFINQGTVKVDAGAGGSLNGATGTALTFGNAGTGSSGGQSGGVFNYDNTTATGAKSQGMGALTFTAGGGTVQVTRTAAQTVGLTFSSMAARTAGATANFVYSNPATGGTLGTDYAINLSGVPLGFISVGHFVDGSDYAFMNALGTYVRHPVYDSDSGFVSGATLTATHNLLTANIGAQATAAITTLKVDSAATRTIQMGASGVLSCDGILVTGGSSLELTAGSGTSGIKAVASAGELVVRADASTDSVILGAVLANGASRLTKTGAGTLTLKSTGNAYTGATVINQGTLLVNAVTTNVSAVTVNSGATLGGSGTVAGAVTLNSDGIIQPSISGGTNTLTLSSATAPSFATSAVLKVRVPTSSTADKVALSSATPRFNCSNLDLVIDTTGLSGNASGLTIVTTVNASGVQNRFRSVTANNGYTATVTYNTNSVTIDLTGGSGPEIAVEQPAATNIANNGSKDFGNVTIGSDTPLTFTILNTGGAALNLTSSPRVIVGGTHAADFTVTTDASTPVAAAGTTTFTVEFAPGASGARSATLTIANNDSDEGSFVINVTGTGQTFYDSWAAGFTPNPGGVALNPDGDSLTNLQEFGFAFDPNVSDGTGPLTISGGAITQNGPPQIYPDPVTGQYFLRYTRRTDYIAAGLTYTPQFASDSLGAGSFVDVTGGGVVVGTGTGVGGVAIQAIAVEFPDALPGTGRRARFGRVEVTQTP